MQREEHELTQEEKCVACAYVFKTRGTVREALEEFLESEGLSVGLEHPGVSFKAEFIYWGVRISILLACFFLTFFLLSFTKNHILHVGSSYGIIEFIITSVSALGLFILIDDNLLE